MAKQKVKVMTTCPSCSEEFELDIGNMCYKEKAQHK